MSKPFVITKSPRVANSVDIAARYLVYKLYSATDGQSGAWCAIQELGEKRDTVERAVERGWVVIREIKSGRGKVPSGALTDAGKVVARKGLRG